MPRCFVMQPFDGDEFDKRFDEIYKPAIEEAGYEPYRVDRDSSASIPIAHVESGIRESAVCFADITIDNPNVWFELGFAICANKPMCLVCGHERAKFPFDVQHRMIIRYKKSSPSDFITLRKSIVSRLKSINEKEETIESIIKDVPQVKKGILSLLEFSALCVVFENLESDKDEVPLFNITNDMERIGYTKMATKAALHGLVNKDMISRKTEESRNDDSTYYVYRTLYKGEDYIMENLDKIQLKRQSKASGVLERAKAAQLRIDDDIPF